MKIKKVITALIVAVVSASCTPAATVVPTRMIIPISTITPTATFTPTSAPNTPTPEIKKDTIYFWRLSAEKSELWHLEPNDRNSNILYAVDYEHTLEEVTSHGLLSREGAESIKEYISTHVNKAEENNGNPSVHIIPVSLSLSPDRKRLAWEEEIGYCPPLESGFDVLWCLGERVLRVFDLEKNKLQITLNTKTLGIMYKPLWSSDSRYLAFREEGGLIKVLDIRTALVDVAGKGHEFCWSPDGHKLAFEFRDEIQMYDLQTKQVTQIPANSGDVLQLAISPNGETLAYTYFNPGTSDLLFTINLKTEKNKPVLKANPGLWIYNVLWLSDTHIFYTQQQSYPDPYYIYVRDIETGQVILSEEIPLDIMPDDSAQLSADGAKILFIGFNHSDKLTFMVFDLIAKDWSFIPVPQEIVPPHNGKFWDYNSLQNATW